MPGLSIILAVVVAVVVAVCYGMMWFNKATDKSGTTL